MNRENYLLVLLFLVLVLWTGFLLGKYSNELQLKYEYYLGYADGVETALAIRDEGLSQFEALSKFDKYHELVEAINKAGKDK